MNPTRRALIAGGAVRRAVPAGLLLLLCALLSCAQVPTMRGEIEGLSKVASQAERNGALRCAPRELAMAKSHLSFATVELDQGFVLCAKQYLDIAQSNAHATASGRRPARAPRPVSASSSNNFA